MKNVGSNITVPEPFDVALVLADDPDYVERVRKMSGDAGSAVEAAPGPFERVAKRAPLLDLVAGVIVWCRRIAPSSGDGLRSLVALFVLLLFLVFVQNASLIRLNVARNRLVVRIPFGPSGNLRKKFMGVKREVRKRLPELGGYLAPSHGPTRHARSRYFSFLALSCGMSARAIAEHWLALTLAWSGGNAPRSGAAEWDAYCEWQPKGKAEELAPTDVRRILRDQRERIAAAEKYSGPPAASDSGPSVALDEPPSHGVVTFTVGLDDVDQKFVTALALAKEHQPRLLGHRAPSRGPARTARAAYFVYRSLSANEGPTAIVGHWRDDRIVAWSSGKPPAKHTPERRPFREWVKRSRKPEDLEPTKVGTGLRAWRAHNAAVERANLLTPDVGGGGEVS